MSSRGTVTSQDPYATGNGPGPALAIDNLSHTFRTPDGGVMDALRDVSLTVRENEFFTVVGPTGCGKSTLLNIAAGLVAPSRGSVSLVKNTPSGPARPTVGYITQDSNLLPWYTAIQNIALGLEARRVPRADRLRRAAEWARRVGLEGFENHYPRHLSGGMQKRCSIARTMVYEPDVLFMDEPFSSLDAITRTLIHKVFMNICEDSRKTIVFITHDLDEALALSDRVAVMSGRPGHITTVVDVPFPRPRELDRISRAPGFQDLHDKLWSLLEADLPSV